MKVTVDSLVFYEQEQERKVLLVKRKYPPFEGSWALPGGFLEEQEAPLEGALRELKEETGLGNVPLTQMHTFGDPGRDPRDHIVTIVYMGLLTNSVSARAGSDAAEVGWFSIGQLPPLAFDHEKIINMGITLLEEDS